MPFDPEAVETITVDSYGTLVDPSAAEDAVAPYVEDVDALLARWRANYLSYVLVVDEVDDYQPFDDLIKAGLEQALGAQDVETTPAEKRDILSTYDNLDPFPDVQSGLERLADAYDVYVLSMGTPSMLAKMLDSADLGDYIEDTISVDEIGRYKPAAAVYQHAAARTGTPIDSIAHAAGPTFDIRGAMAAGMQGVWVNRDIGPWDPCYPTPALTVSSFDEFAEILDV